MTQHAPTRRFRIALLVAGLSLVAALGCDSSDDATGVIDTRWRVEISTGLALRGVTVNLFHDDGFSVQQVTPIGPFASSTCQANVSTGSVRLICANTSDANAPFDGWELILRHDAAVAPESEVLSMTCTGALANGDTIAVACDLD